MRLLEIALIAILLASARKLLWCLRWLWCWRRGKPLPEEIHWLPRRDGEAFDAQIRRRSDRRK